ENRVYLSGKPNAPAYSGITTIVIGVDDLTGAIAKYRKTYGLSAPRVREDARLKATTASFEGTPVVLAKPLPGENWMAARIKKYGDVVCEFGIARAGTGVIQWIR